MILALLLFGAMFVLPFFLAIIGFILCAFAIYIMLAKLGILKVTTFTQSETDLPSQPRTNTDGTDDSGWDDEMKEAEIITLPETALRKSDELKDDDPVD